MPSFISFYPTVWPSIKDKQTWKIDVLSNLWRHNSKTGSRKWMSSINCHLILIICRMALVPSRSDEIEKLKLPGDLDPVTFDLELDPLKKSFSQERKVRSTRNFHHSMYLFWCHNYQLSLLSQVTWSRSPGNFNFSISSDRDGTNAIRQIIKITIYRVHTLTLKENSRSFPGGFQDNKFNFPGVFGTIFVEPACGKLDIAVTTGCRARLR